MRIGIVHTGRSACRCHVALRKAARALGHEAIVVENERLEDSRAALAAADVVVDHSDTFRGSHDARAEVRRLLERWGCRLAGASAESAALADDKIAAHRALERAGAPVPAWLPILLPCPRAPSLPFPVVVKPSTAHGSAGLRFIASPADWPRLSPRLSRRWIAEVFISGRELALSGIEERGRIRWLPEIEVSLPPHALYSHSLKWSRRNPRKSVARLAPALRRRLRRLAAKAWRALGLRDYARFDLRLAGSRIHFLEANVRPSVEPGSEFRRAAAAAGLDAPAVIRKILASASQRRRPKTGAPWPPA